jgi:hypothetical protein
MFAIDNNNCNRVKSLLQKDSTQSLKVIKIGTLDSNRIVLTIAHKFGCMLRFR